MLANDTTSEICFKKYHSYTLWTNAYDDLVWIYQGVQMGINCDHASLAFWFDLATKGKLLRCTIKHKLVLCAS